MSLEANAKALLHEIGQRVVAAKFRDHGALHALEDIRRLLFPGGSSRASCDGGEAHRVLENLVATIPYYVFWKDRDGRYLGCNQAFAEAAGFDSPAALTGKRDDQLPWTPEETRWLKECDGRVMASGRAESFIEEAQLQTDGRKRWVSTCRVPLRDRDERVVGVLGIYHDITDRKELEAALTCAMDASEVALRAKSDFLAALLAFTRCGAGNLTPRLGTI
jgi:PAS domain S-box-containing protein